MGHTGNGDHNRKKSLARLPGRPGGRTGSRTCRLGRVEESPEGRTPKWSSRSKSMS